MLNLFTFSDFRLKTRRLQTYFLVRIKEFFYTNKYIKRPDYLRTLNRAWDTYVYRMVILKLISSPAFMCYTMNWNT